MQHVRARDAWTAFGSRSDDDIPFLDDALVELVEEPRPGRRAMLELVEEPARPASEFAFDREPERGRAPVDFEDAPTRVWIRPYAARLRLVGVR